MCLADVILTSAHNIKEQESERPLSLDKVDLTPDSQQIGQCEYTHLTAAFNTRPPLTSPHARLPHPETHPHKLS